MTQNCNCKGSKDTVNDSGIVCCAVCFLPIPDNNKEQDEKDKISKIELVIFGTGGEISNDDYDDWELAPETKIVNVYQNKMK